MYFRGVMLMSTYEALSIMLSILTLVVVLLIELIKKK
ncbi:MULTISPECIES: putative holin-like toxin [Bacillota]